MAFDGFGARVKEVVGALTHDETLLDAGRLTGPKLAELRRSVELETQAKVRRADADRERDERLAADAERRRGVTERAEARERAIDKTRDAQERDVAARLEQEKAAAAEAEAQAAAAAANANAPPAPSASAPSVPHSAKSSAPAAEDPSSTTSRTHSTPPNCSGRAPDRHRSVVVPECSSTATGRSSTRTTCTPSRGPAHSGPRCVGPDERHSQTRRHGR